MARDMEVYVYTSTSFFKLSDLVRADLALPRQRNLSHYGGRVTQSTSMSPGQHERSYEANERSDWNIPFGKNGTSDNG